MPLVRAASALGIEISEGQGIFGALVFLLVSSLMERLLYLYCQSVSWPIEFCPWAPIFSERRRQTMPNFKAGILPELIHLVVVRGRRSLIAVLRVARRGSVRTSI